MGSDCVLTRMSLGWMLSALLCVAAALCLAGCRDQSSDTPTAGLVSPTPTATGPSVSAAPPTPTARPVGPTATESAIPETAAPTPTARPVSPTATESVRLVPPTPTPVVDAVSPTPTATGPSVSAAPPTPTARPVGPTATESAIPETAALRPLRAQSARRRPSRSGLFHPLPRLL